MKKEITCLISLFIILSSIIVVSTTGDSTDISTWYLGDEWTYNSTIFLDSENGSFNGTITDLKMNVIDVSNIEVSNQTFDVYVLNISGNITGMVTYSDIINGELNGVIDGVMFVRRADLSTVMVNITSVGTIHQIFYFGYEANATIIYTPPIEYFDFPINVGENWSIYSNMTASGSFEVAGLLTKSFNESSVIRMYAGCSEEETISTPAGAFDTFHIVSEENGSYESWYSPVVGNAVKSITNTVGNITLHTTTILISYNLFSQPINLTEEIQPSVAIIGQSINVSGRATMDGDPIPHGNVSIKIPSTNDIWYTTTDNSGYYSISFPSPAITDSTPTVYDLGSDGVIASISYNLSQGYIIKTLTVIKTIWEKELLSGWNFVTIACENNYTASSLYNSIQGCNLILKWNNSKNDFDVYTHGSPNNFAIENGTGYFISVSNNTILSVTGMPIQSVNITLLVGWNSLGWFNPTQTNASDVYNNIAGCNIILKWNNSRDDFDVYVPNAPDFVIEQGNGFFVSVSQQSQWHG